MIELTKLNNQKFVLNALYIERVESTPDSVITLTNDKRIIVRESIEEINKAVREFYQHINFFHEIKGVKRSDEK